MGIWRIADELVHETQAVIEVGHRKYMASALFQHYFQIQDNGNVLHHV